MAGPAMTPAEAVAALADVRRQRELLTGRALGIIWVVWGMAWGLVGCGALLGTLPDAAVPLWYQAVAAALPVLVAAFLSNMVWRAHALQRDPRSNPWWPWLTAPVLVAVVGVSNVVHGRFLYREDALVLARLALVAAWGALLFAFVARRRASTTTGMVAAVALASLYGAASVVRVGSGLGALLGNTLVASAVLVVYAAAGAWTYRRG